MKLKDLVAECRGLVEDEKPEHERYSELAAHYRAQMKEIEDAARKGKTRHGSVPEDAMRYCGYREKAMSFERSAKKAKAGIR